MKNCYKVIKNFQGGQGIYYAEISTKKVIRKGCWDYQLEEWGENTAGGHGYGYRMDAKKCKRPKVISKRSRLHFNKYYLEKK